jgi:hypothetical protein
VQAPTAYGNSISAPAGADRPSPRNVSNAIFGSPPFSYSSFSLTSVKTAWGQFIAHDVAWSSPDSPVEHLDIPIPCCDPQFDAQCTCSRTQPFARVESDPATGTSAVNPRMQVNGQTAFIDASTVYGFSVDRGRLLRAPSGGKLLSDPVNGCPLNADGALMATGGGLALTKQRLAGDIRANVNPGILSLHCLFVKEHNRWCDVLAQQNPQYDDETLYQEARKVSCALCRGSLR